MLRRRVRPSARPFAVRSWPAVLGIGLLTVLGSHEATAAALGSVVASTGLLATLLTLFAMKGWSAIASAETASTAGGALLVAAAAAWLVPNRTRPRVDAAPSGARGPQTPRVPQPTAAMGALGIDPGPLCTELVTLFCRVQSAWDEVEVAALRSSTTPDMFDELMRERAHCLSPSGCVRTVILAVEAELLEYEELATAAVVTVAFSGSLCDDDGRAPVPFRELWLLIKPVAESRWKLARHQTLY